MQRYRHCWLFGSLHPAQIYSLLDFHALKAKGCRGIAFREVTQLHESKG